MVRQIRARKAAEQEQAKALDSYAEREQRWHWALIAEQNANNRAGKMQARAEATESSLAAVLAGIEELAAANDIRMGRSGASAYTGIGSDALRALVASTTEEGQ